MQTRYYSLLDILRFLAALFVMLFHYYSGVLERKTDLLSVAIVHGYLGVELFFIISGFVIYNSLKDKGGALDWKAYVWSRFIRLYPLFWILCTITYVMTIYMAASHLPFTTYLFNLLILNNGKTANMIDGSYWTLTIEILFYFYIGIFAYIAGKKNIIYFFAIWMIYSFTAYTFGFSELLISKLLLVRYAPYFVYGGSLAILIQAILDLYVSLKEKKYKSHKEKQDESQSNFFYFFKIKEIILPIFLLITSIFMTKYISTHLIAINELHSMTNKFAIFNGTNQTIVYYIFATATLFTFLSLYIKNKTLIKYLQIIGLATYPLYLIHQRLGSMIIELYTDFGVIDIYSVFITIVLVLVAIYIGIIDKDMRKYTTLLYLRLPWGSSAKR